MHKLLLIAAILLAPQTTNAEEFLKGDLSAWIGAESVSHDQEAVMLGVSLEWKYFTFEIGHGTKRTKWRVPSEPEWEMDDWQSGTNSALRWHPFDTGFIRPHIIWRHASDIARGRPFNDKKEPTSDFLGVGFTLSQVGEPIAIDFEYGFAARECDLFECHKSARTDEIRVAIRVRFWE